MMLFYHYYYFFMSWLPHAYIKACYCAVEDVP